MKVLVFLADGFEEVEALTVVDYLRRMEVEVDLVSIGEDRQVSGSHGITVLADKLMKDIDSISSYDGLVVPGGLPGASNLRDNERVIQLIKDMDEKEGMLAAICAGPIVLERAGVIEGKEITSYPGFEDQLKSGNYKQAPALLDANIITARGPYYAVDFAIEIVKYLLGEEKAQELMGDILYNELTNL